MGTALNIYSPSAKTPEARFCTHRGSIGIPRGEIDFVPINPVGSNPFAWNPVKWNPSFGQYCPFDRSRTIP